MRTSASEDRSFIEAIIPTSFLEEAVDYITSNFEVEEVYGREALEEWSENNGYVQESKVEELENILEEVREELLALKFILEEGNL